MEQDKIEINGNIVNKNVPYANYSPEIRAAVDKFANDIQTFRIALQQNAKTEADKNANEFWDEWLSDMWFNLGMEI
jgi:hypothetical protein